MLTSAFARRRLPGRPGWWIVGATVVAGSAYLAHWTLQVRQFEFMVDELVYERMAISFARTLSPIPQIHDHFSGYLSALYPLLIAPAYGFFATPTAFAVAHAMNAVMFASAAIPAYLLSRNVGAGRAAAWACAAIAVVVPWAIFARLLMTEVAAYPIFLWAVLALHRCLVRGGVRADLLAVGAIVLAFLARPQFVYLAPLLVVAVVAHELGLVLAARDGSLASGVRALPRGLLRRHRALAVIAAAALLVYAVLAATGNPRRVLAAYGDIAGGQLLPPGVWESARQHLAIVGFGIGMLPLAMAAAFVLATLVRPPDRSRHAFAVLLALIVPVTVVVSASVNIRTISGLIQERYAFYLAPLLVIGMVAFLVRPDRPAVRVPAIVAGTVLGAWVMTAYSDAVDHLYSFLAPAIGRVANWTTHVAGWIDRPHLTPNQLLVAALLGLCAVLLGLSFVRRSWPAPLLALVAVGGFSGWETTFLLDQMTPPGQPPLHRGQDWVDRTLPAGAKAAIVPAYVSTLDVTRDAWWDVEFWNKDVVRQYFYPPAFGATEFPTQGLLLDERTGALSTPHPVPYLVMPLAPRHMGIEGTRLATSGLLALYRAPLPLRARWTISNTNPDGWSSPGQDPVISLYPRRTAGATEPVRVVIDLVSDPSLTDRTFTIAGGVHTVRGEVPPGATKTVVVPACIPASGRRTLRIHIPQSSPLQGGLPAGLAITRVDPLPARVPCRA